MKLMPKRTKEFNFIGLKWLWFAISGVIIVVAIVALLIRGLNFGIDFTGGTEFDIKVKSGTTLETVRSATASVGFGAAQIQSEGSNKYIVRVPKLDEAKKTQLEDALKTKGNMTEILGINDVGPGWGGQVSRQALIAVLVFIAAIMLYISIRFEFKMAVTAIIEIVHDLVITVGVYALSGRSVTPATVIAVLTILGYSLYDTIVVFDRIKENGDQLTRQSRKTYSDVVNDSVNQVLVRSINTSLTTLIPIVALLIFGGATLQAFAFPLFVGVLAGTYSSIILAPPILAMWKETEPKFMAYKEQVERKQTREARVSAAGAVAVPMPKTSAGKPATKPSQAPQKKAAGGKAAAGPAKKPAAAARPQPKPAAKAQGEGAAEVPKPKPKAQGGPTTKSQAKSRTKGPGSGKKKKKKR
ncbi:MAG: protein translocase subunit SecF [Candidatus Geothermincolia bacterium]